MTLANLLALRPASETVEGGHEGVESRRTAPEKLAKHATSRD